MQSQCSRQQLRHGLNERHAPRPGHMMPCRRRGHARSVVALAKKLIALDFDGVVCDSCGESSLSAFKVRHLGILASTQQPSPMCRLLVLSLHLLHAAFTHGGACHEQVKPVTASTPQQNSQMCMPFTHTGCARQQGQPGGGRQHIMTQCRPNPC